MAYLATKGVISKTFLERYGGVGKCFLWSTRGWFAYICLQFVKLARQHVLRNRKYAAILAPASASAGGSGKEEEKEKKEKEDALNTRNEEVRAAKKSLVGNLLWAPLALHWSLEKGLGIPKPLMSPVMLSAGAWDLFDSWNVTSLR